MDGAVALVPGRFLGSLGAQLLRVDRARGENEHHVQFAAHVQGD